MQAKKKKTFTFSLEASMKEVNCENLTIISVWKNPTEGNTGKRCFVNEWSI